MTIKPSVWGVSPALAEAPTLWEELALVAPFWQRQGNLNVLFDKNGQLLAEAALTAGSTLQWRGTPYGLGVGISGASNLLQQNNIEFIKTSDGVGTGDMTMLVLANPIAEARVSWGLAQGNLTDNTNVALAFNTEGSFLTATSSTFSFVTRNLDVATNVFAANVIDGNYHLLGGRRRGTTVEVIVDGVVRASATGTVRDIATGALGFAIGQRPEGTTFRIDTGTDIVLALAWNRALSDLEMRLLARDPFIMFRQRRNISKYYVAAGGGGGAKIYYLGGNAANRGQRGMGWAA